VFGLRGFSAHRAERETRVVNCTLYASIRVKPLIRYCLYLTLPVASVDVSHSHSKDHRPQFPMVETDAQSRADELHFVIKPNSSLSWRGNQFFLACMIVLSSTVAGAFAFQGAWMVLPFAGLEMLLLALALYLCCMRSYRQEVVSIGERQVRVTIGRKAPECACTFERSWAQVILAKAKTRGYPTRLVIRSHGREIEIGTCLVEDERLKLAAALRAAL
jgi:uncharacterized membrane protein